LIDRYSSEKMKNIWSEKNKFDAWLKVEIAACRAWCSLGIIPVEDVQKIEKKAFYSLMRIHALEKISKHDVVAFISSVSESLGEEKRWIHYGLTSTDVVDTAFGFLLKQANDVILRGLDQFLKTLKRRAFEFQNTPQIGRTHGIHAEITSFGLELALWYNEMKRNKKRFELARYDVEFGKISGAVGNHANVPRAIQKLVCSELGITPARISTQTLQRDRHAFYLNTLALIGSSLEKMAMEIRHLQRTEVSEVQEFFEEQQKGSSAMPHKQNPIGSENICGLARVLRGYALSSYENISLWHQRDISHSSVERIIVPDATTLMENMLKRFDNIIANLLVNKRKMRENINLTFGVIYSQRVLLTLVEKGCLREKAHQKVQKIAEISWHKKKDFYTLLKNNQYINKYLTEDELQALFDPKYYLRKVESIFLEVFEE